MIKVRIIYRVCVREHARARDHSSQDIPGGTNVPSVSLRSWSALAVIQSKSGGGAPASPVSKDAGEAVQKKQFPPPLPFCSILFGPSAR